MQHKSTFNLTIGKALIQQIDVCADVSRCDDGDWYVSAVYFDVIERDGVCPKGEDYEEIPSSHPLHNDVLMHFLTKCHDAIEARWSRRRGDRPDWLHANSAGRTL